MIPQGRFESNLHRVGIILPYEVIEVLPDLLQWAGQRLAERFGSTIGRDGTARWERTDGETGGGKIIILHCVVTGAITELDLAILTGIALQVSQRIDGVAVIVDDDLLMI